MTHSEFKTIEDFKQAHIFTPSTVIEAGLAKLKRSELFWKKLGSSLLNRWHWRKLPPN